MTEEHLLGEVTKNLWRTRVAPADHGCEAAYGYMSLLLDHRSVRHLKDPKMWGTATSRRANDILRACRLEPLPLTDTGVHEALLKAMAGYPLEPVQIISWGGEVGAEMADGRHRVSLAYLLSPKLDVPCFVMELGHPGVTERPFYP